MLLEINFFKAAALKDFLLFVNVSQHGKLPPGTGLPFIFISHTGSSFLRLQGVDV